MLSVGMTLYSSGALAQDVPQLNESSFEVEAYEQDFIIGNPLFTDSEIDGNVITSFDSDDAGRTVYANIKMRDTSGQNPEVTAVTAVYNLDGIMKSVCMANQPLSSKNLETLTYAVELPVDFDETFRIKTYVMDSVSGMWAYCKTFDFESDGGVGSAWSFGDAWKLQSEDSYDGLSSLKLTPKTGGSKAYQYFEVNPNSTYRMSFMGKGSAPFSVASLDIDGKFITNPKQINPESEWKEYSYLFSSSDDGRTAVSFEGIGNDGTSFIDYIKIMDDFMVNGGFEFGSDNWSFSDSAVSVSSAEKSEGNNSLAIKAVSYGVGAESEIDIMPNSVYILAFKAKCADKIKCYASNGEKNVAEITLSASSSWKDYYLAVDTAEIEKVKIGFESETASSKISYIDEVRLVNPASSNFIPNGNAEDGATGWNQSLSAGENSAAVKPTEDDAYLGRYSNHITRSELYTMLIWQLSDKIKETGDGLYYIGGWIKTTNGGTPVFQLRKFYTTLSNLNSDLKAYGIKGNNDWQYVCGVFDITNTDDLRTFNFNVYTGSGTPQVGDYYLDNLCVLKIK